MICGVADTRLTERLLRTTDLDLEKTISICRAAESSQEQLRVIEGDNDRGVEVVAARPKQAQQTDLPEIMETHTRALVVAVFTVKDIAQQQGRYATIVKGRAISLLCVAIIPEKFIQ